ncbi:cellulose biosynthesis protein BcsD [Croceicoccus marinus]|uniref:Cellulose synthase n=1 Tax=Croceicoccus marinus TaxID=450378 RepID=A0A1Z1FGA8_9SPHN|nr:cellulose biosynthesis protein BcsD [Croceicoccus marinus]ARU17765.1 hypothetical protein A9D14_15495 [Croceicoccus marinus]
MMNSAYNTVEADGSVFGPVDEHFTAETVQFMLEMVIEQIRASASADQTHGFFVATGRRMAALAQLGDLSNVDDIQLTLNIVWNRMRLGAVNFELDDHGLDIVHAGLPSRESGASEAIVNAIPAILEGAYSAWLESLAQKGAPLRTWVVSHSGSRLELRHAP